jgi:hypothetical protein
MKRTITNEENVDAGVKLVAIGSFACLLLEQAGAIVFFFGNAWGLYVVGLGMMSSFVFMVSGAWLLLVGVGTEEAAKSLSSSSSPQI